jgi:hypothetical protein
MALVFRQSITTNVLEVFSLFSAISEHLYKPLTERSAPITPAEFLALEPLRKVSRRLEAKYLREIDSSQHHKFLFNFAPEELLAIYICIKPKPEDHPMLQVIIGKLQQKALNFDHRIELNPKSLRR